MASVLYQKYRSQNFDELVGQEDIANILKNSLKKGQTSQAYLFVGSRGTGKTSTARILAKALNCTNLKDDGNPCNECENCKDISEGRFLDLIEIDAASNRGIDQIRELKERIEFTPSKGNYKVYIIDEVHMLTTEAFNALLKTLEEPPRHVVFILATTDVHKLPPTIISRCQRYDFRLGTDEEVRRLIERVLKDEGVEMEKDALDVVVKNAKGSYRDALSILDVVYSGQENKDDRITLDEVKKTLGLPDFDTVLLLLKYLLEGDGCKALSVLNDVESSGINLQQFTEYVLDILREILVGKIKNDLGKEFDFVRDVDMRGVYRLINLFLEAENKIRYSSNQILVLEMIIPEMMKPNVNTDIEMINRDVKKKVGSKDGSVDSKNDSVKEPVVKRNIIEKIVGKGKNEKESKIGTEKESKLNVQKESGCNGASVSVNEIKEKWELFVATIKPYNGHLYAFLEGANILSFDDGVMHLEVPFEFHKERIEVPKSRNIISEVFNEVYGSSCRVVCDVNSAIKPVGKSTADFVLRNLPTIKKKEEEEQPKEKSNFFQKSTLSKDIEAIFEGV